MVEAVTPPPPDACDAIFVEAVTPPPPDRSDAILHRPMPCRPSLPGWVIWISSIGLGLVVGVSAGLVGMVAIALSTADRMESTSHVGDGADNELWAILAGVVGGLGIGLSAFITTTVVSLIAGFWFRARFNRTTASENRLSPDLDRKVGRPVDPVKPY